MKNYTINYIVALYFGTRVSKKHNELISKSPFYLLDEHLSFLKDCNTNITQVTFVINGEKPDGFLERIENNLPDYVKVKVVERKNQGFSYGGWNDVIVQCLEDNSNFDYYFIIEDDYVPTVDNFYEPFVEKCTNENPFVCGLIGHIPRQHPAISNGLLQNKACKHVYEQCKNVFVGLCVTPGDSYLEAWSTQINFMDNFTSLGFTFNDIIDKYCSPFHSSSTDVVVYFGDTNNPILITSILTKY